MNGKLSGVFGEAFVSHWTNKNRLGDPGVTLRRLLHFPQGQKCYQEDFINATPEGIKEEWDHGPVMADCPIYVIRGADGPI
jgi:hypothetical protein